MGSLEKLVFTHRRRGPVLEIVGIDLATESRIIVRRNLEHAGLFITPPMSWEAQQELLYQIRAKPSLTRSIPYELDGWFYIMAETKSVAERNQLPPIFIAAQAATLAPRTQVLEHKMDARHVREFLNPIGLREVEAYDKLTGQPIFEGGRRQFGVLQEEEGYKVQVSPLTQPQFEEFITGIAGTYADEVFRTHEMRLTGFKSKETAQEYISKHRRKIHAARNSAVAMTVRHGSGFNTIEEHIIRCICTPAEREHLAKQNFQFSGRKANRYYADPVGEGSQRLIEQLLYKPFHTFDGRPATQEEFHAAIAILDKQSLALDLEMDDSWFEELLGSGNISQFIIGSTEGVRIYCREDLMPANPPEHLPVEVIPIKDELEGQRAVSKELKETFFYFWHNGRHYDNRQLHRNDHRKTNADSVRWYKQWRKEHAPGGLDPEVKRKVRHEMHRIQEQTNALRAHHTQKGVVVDRWPPSVDGMQYIGHDREIFETGISVEQIMRFIKSISATTGLARKGQRENWHDEEGLLTNLIYAYMDGKMEHEEKQMLLPAMAFSSFISGVPINQLQNLTPFDMLHREWIKTMRAADKSLYTRTSFQELEETKKHYGETLKHLRSLTVAPQVTAFFDDAALYYNPLILASQRNLFPAHILAALEEVRPIYSRTISLHELEWFASPVLGEIYAGLQRYAAWLREKGRDQRAKAVLNLEEYVSARVFGPFRFTEEQLSALYNKNVSVEDQYDRLYRELRSVRNELFEAQAGPFLVSHQQQARRTYLGSGNIATVRAEGKSHFIAVIDEVPLVYHLRVQGSDEDKYAQLMLHKELFDAVRERRVPQYEGELKGAWDRVAHGITAALEGQLSFI